MMIREPARAGSFYPGSPDKCRADARRLVVAVDPGRLPPGELLGGIVPHAGWVFSGAVAGKVLATLAASGGAPTVVIFGAMHQRRGGQACMFGSGAWETPAGRIEIDQRLAERVQGHTSLIVNDPYAHEQEHSIEVQVPLLQQVMPDCKLLPILVPPVDTAAEVGRAVAGTVEAYGSEAIFVGSTDLTHYGPTYGMTSHGAGPEGFAWAKQVNDRRMIDLILGLDAEGVVPEAAEHHNACGAGAVAATLAAVKRLGATEAVLLEHTSSAEVMPSPHTEDAVGYAGIVFAAGEGA